MHSQCWICFPSWSVVVVCEPLLLFLWTSVTGSWRTRAWNGASLTALRDYLSRRQDQAELDDSKARQLLGRKPRGPNSMPGRWKKYCQSPLKYSPRPHGTGVAELGIPRTRDLLNQKRGGCHGRKVLGSLWISNQDRMSSVTIKSCAPKLKESLYTMAMQKEALCCSLKGTAIMSPRIKHLYALKRQPNYF